MAHAIARDVELNVLRDEVRQLRRLVVEMDSDMAELEWHVDYIDDQVSTFRCAIGGLFQSVFGRESTNVWVTWVHNKLYPDSMGDGWQIPRRRWSQYGTREELVALAVEHGVGPGRRREGREWIVRRLHDAGVRPSLRSADR